jgi:hypothetical protein
MSNSIKMALTLSGLWVGLLHGCGGVKFRESTLTSAQKAEAEAGRDNACDTLRQLEPGAFSKIESGDSGPIHAYVNKEFYEVPIYRKETALKAAALCYFDSNKPDQQGVVIVHDGDSGKVIGRFELNSGLSLE